MHIAQSIGVMHAGSTIAAEPNIKSLPASIDEIKLIDLAVALDVSDIQLMLVDHKEFKNIDNVNGIVIDTKGLW